MKSLATERARRQLDITLETWQPCAQHYRPAKGWIRAIRDALGMTASTLAKRLDKAPTTTLQFERSEAAGTITLNTLHSVAEAMECQLVYALVPKTTLEDSVTKAAESKAHKEMETVTHTMLLENQALSETQQQQMFDDLVADLKAHPKRLWD